MDNAKIGQLIYRLRKEKNMTQLQLAKKLYVSDKAVSKWERGLGCPDITLLLDIANIFDINLEKFLSGDIEESKSVGGNMRKTKFYICENCTNLIMATSDAQVSCCSKKLQPLELKKANEEEKLSVEKIENEFFISSKHEMSKAHYISFVALVSGDSIILKKQYPQWDLSLRLPNLAHSKLLWHCTKDGLFFQDL